MRDIYRACLNRVATDEALMLAHALDRWHGDMEQHRAAIVKLGFAPDGHPGWDDCPHAEARRLWERALRLFGKGADSLELLRSCAMPGGARPPARVRQPWFDGHRDGRGVTANTVAPTARAA